MPTRSLRRVVARPSSSQLPRILNLDPEAQILDVLQRIVVKPLSCELAVPQTVPGTNQQIDFGLLRVRSSQANGSASTEFPRTAALATCGADAAWYYDDPLQPTTISFCKTACQLLAAADTQVELGGAPQRTGP